MQQVYVFVVRLMSMLTDSSLHPQEAALHGSISSNPPVGIPVCDPVFSLPLLSR